MDQSGGNSNGAIEPIRDTLNSISTSAGIEKIAESVNSPFKGIGF